MNSLTGESYQNVTDLPASESQDKFKVADSKFGISFFLLVLVEALACVTDGRTNWKMQSPFLCGGEGGDS